MSWNIDEEYWPGPDEEPVNSGTFSSSNINIAANPALLPTPGSIYYNNKGVPVGIVQSVNTVTNTVNVITYWDMSWNIDETYWPGPNESKEIIGELILPDGTKIGVTDFYFDGVGYRNRRPIVWENIDGDRTVLDNLRINLTAN